MDKNHVDIIVDANGIIVATAPVGSDYLIEPAEGQKKHRIELPKHVSNTNASEFHHVISHLLYFENGVAKVNEMVKKK
ncbi:MAG: hypothetical protein WCL00_01095 [Bacteroidota bacterium]